MEKALRSESQKLYQEVINRDEEIMAGKRLVATLEKEKAETERLLEQSAAEPQEQKTNLEVRSLSFLLLTHINCSLQKVPVG